MKVLTATINYDHPQTGILRAFEGIFGPNSVVDFDYFQKQRDGLYPQHINSDFAKVAEVFRPDWIFLQLQDSNIIQPETIADIRHRVPKAVISHWTGDLRPEVSPYLGAVSKECDLTLISSMGQVGLFERAGAKRVRYMQIGVDFDEDVLGRPDWTPPFRVPEVVFCANYYGDRFPEGTTTRAASVMALMNAGIDIGIVGAGWPSGFPVLGQCHVKRQHHVYKRAKVALAVNNVNTVLQYYSDRLLIALASGTPVVAWKVPGLHAEFDDGHHLMAAESCENLATTTRWLLDNPEKAAQIGRNGRAEVIRRHTWFHRLTEIMPEIEAIRREKA